MRNLIDRIIPWIVFAVVFCGIVFMWFGLAYFAGVR